MDEASTTKMDLDARLLASEDDEREPDVENQQLNNNNNTTTTQQRRRQRQEQQQQSGGLRPTDCQRLQALTRRQWFFQLYFALAGIPLPESVAPYYPYLLQWIGLGLRGVFVYKIFIHNMEGAAHDAELDENKDKHIGHTELAQDQTSNVLNILLQVVPVAFLFYLTRSREADNCFRMLERVPLKWWLVAVPWIGPLGLAVTSGAFNGPLYLFFELFTYTPQSLGLMLCLAYAMDFGAPSVESLEVLKPKVRAFQVTNKPKVSMMNLGFIGPVVLLVVCKAMDDVWRLASNIEHKDGVIELALYAFFHIATIFCLLAPAVYHTATMTDFVQEMSIRYCDAGGFAAPCPGSLTWLKDEPVGWAVLGVKITPALLAKMGTAVFTAAYAIYSIAIQN